MAIITWNNEGERYYETGTKNGVLYVYDETSKAYGTGVAWNGLTAVTVSPSGAEASPLYADDIKYLNLISAEEVGATIEAYQSPKEFDVCDGTASAGIDGVSFGQQKRSKFAFCFTSSVGNDVEGSDYGEKIHILYGCLAAPSERSYASVNEDPEAIILSWEVTTTPVPAGEGFKPTALVTIDTKKVPEEKLTIIKQHLYGTESTEPKLIMPNEFATIAAPVAD